MLIHVEGESGLRWVVDEREDAAISRRGRFFLGWEEGNEAHRVWVQRVLAGELFSDDRDHLLQAFTVSQLPPLAGCRFIRRVLDKAEPYDLYLFQELADASLDEVLRAGPLSGEALVELEHNLTAALEAIHSANLVHADIQTSNVLLVDGVWKLADLGHASSPAKRRDGCLEILGSGCRGSAQATPSAQKPTGTALGSSSRTPAAGRRKAGHDPGRLPRNRGQLRVSCRDHKLVSFGHGHTRQRRER